MKIEKQERTTKVEIKKEQDEESSVVQELSDKINYLNDVISQSEKQMGEKEKEIAMLTESNNEWEAKTRLLFVEIQQQELIQEKREYERNLRISEMAHRYQEQKTKIAELEDKIQMFKHKESVEMSKKHLEQVNGISPSKLSILQPGGSFVSAGAPAVESKSPAQTATQSQLKGSQLSGTTGGMGIKEEDEEDETLRAAPQDQEVKKVEVVETEDGEQRQSFVQEDGELQGNEFAQMENEFEGFNTENITGGDIIVQETDEGNMLNDPTSQPGSFVLPENNDIDQEYRSNSDHDSLNNDIDIGDVNLTDGKASVVKSPIPVAPLPVQNINLNPLADSPDIESALPIRRDPEEEYFMLAVLAHKMLHTEENDSEYIYEINGQKLFQQVKSLKIPFHRWYNWLGDRFSQLQKVHQEETMSKEQEMQRWQAQQ